MDYCLKTSRSLQYFDQLNINQYNDHVVLLLYKQKPYKQFLYNEYLVLKHTNKNSHTIHLPTLTAKKYNEIKNIKHAVEKLTVKREKVILKLYEVSDEFEIPKNGMWIVESEMCGHPIYRNDLRVYHWKIQPSTSKIFNTIIAKWKKHQQHSSNTKPNKKILSPEVYYHGSGDVDLSRLKTKIDSIQKNNLCVTSTIGMLGRGIYLGHFFKAMRFAMYSTYGGHIPHTKAYVVRVLCFPQRVKTLTPQSILKERYCNCDLVPHCKTNKNRNQKLAADHRGLWQKQYDMIYLTPIRGVVSNDEICISRGDMIYMYDCYEVDLSTRPEHYEPKNRDHKVIDKEYYGFSTVQCKKILQV
jgi:hypothetical protein